MTITTMNAPQKIPAKHHLMLLCVCDPLHLVRLSPFFLPFAHGALWSVSLTRISSPLRSLLCWFLEPTAACRQGICPHLSSFQQHEASGKELGGALTSTCYGRRCTEGLFILLLVAQGTQQGEGDGVRSGTIC